LIDKDNLLKIAKMMGLTPWQQEKHYVQSLILSALSETEIVFKGGTYLWFFHGLKRFSEDLDFTVTNDVNGNLPAKVSSEVDSYGVENKVKIIANNEWTLSFRISAKGPLNTSERNLCFVYVEMSKREKIIKKTIPIKFDYPAYKLPVKRFAGMNLDEVGAEKVRAILTRVKARDIYDFYFLISEKKINFDKELINEKLEYYKKSFSKAEFLKNVKGREKYYVKELKNIVFGDLPHFSEVYSTIHKWTE